MVQYGQNRSPTAGTLTIVSEDKGLGLVSPGKSLKSRLYNIDKV